MAQFVNDTFSGATSGADLNTRANWTQHGSLANAMTFTPDADPRVRSTVDTSHHLYYHSGTPANANYTVVAGVIVDYDTGSFRAGVAARIQTGAVTFYTAYLDDNYNPGTAGNYWKLSKFVNGTETVLDYSGPIGSLTRDSLTYVIELSVDGDSLVMRVDTGSGLSEVCSATDSSITTAGKAGLYAYDGVTNTIGFNIDYITADDIAASNFTGEVTATLGGINSAAVAALKFTGAISATVAGAAGAASGGQKFSGAQSGTLGGAAGAAAASLRFKGPQESTLGGLSSAADGETFIAQHAYAASVISRGGWTDESGTASDAAILAALQDLSTSNYAQTREATDTLEVTLDSLLSADGRFMRYAYGKGAGTMTRNLVVSLRSPDGSTLVRQWTHNDVSNGFTTVGQDVSDLSLSGAYRVRFEVS